MEIGFIIPINDSSKIPITDALFEISQTTKNIVRHVWASKGWWHRKIKFFGAMILNYLQKRVWRLLHFFSSVSSMKLEKGSNVSAHKACVNVAARRFDSPFRWGFENWYKNTKYQFYLELHAKYFYNSFFSVRCLNFEKCEKDWFSSTILLLIGGLDIDQFSGALSVLTAILPSAQKFNFSRIFPSVLLFLHWNWTMLGKNTRSECQPRKNWNLMVFHFL